MADPEDDVALRGVMFATGAREIEPMVATFGDVEEALARLSGTDAILQDSSAFADIAPDDEAERLTETESDAPVIRLVHRLLANAVNRRASDVHIEPMARHLAVRYRIDGRLTEVERLPHALAGPIASRIKIMSALDIAECRLPQDGRLRLTVKGRDVDVRVSTSPIAHGESLVLRLLGRTEVPLDLDQLGLSPTSLKRLKSALERPHGMILLTGPTGSGKTTTLYAAINRLRRPEVKILTVEDPVEVLLDGINQVQVRPDIDLGYPATLRAFLRQDPDILMIGEIRDRETADIAMRAALTGHLVLSTLHTNSAIGAFTRLRDIGIEPFLTASTIIATLAQRLVRGLCTHCAQSRPLSSEERRLFTSCDIVQPPHLFEPSGCEQCGGTGFSGRVPLIDYFEVNEAARTAIRDGSISDWENRQRGAESLLGHGLSLVAIGRTALSEVRRVVDAG
jgi:general secretion pathway protein E